MCITQHKGVINSSFQLIIYHKVNFPPGNTGSEMKCIGQSCLKYCLAVLFLPPVISLCQYLILLYGSTIENLYSRWRIKIYLFQSQFACSTFKNILDLNVRYGYVTNSKVKFVIVVDSANTSLRDNEIRSVSLNVSG